MKKTARLDVRISTEDKKKLLEKAGGLKLSLTSYLEKISREKIIFADANLRAALDLFELQQKKT